MNPAVYLLSAAIICASLVLGLSIFMQRTEFDACYHKAYEIYFGYIIDDVYSVAVERATFKAFEECKPK